MRALPLLFLAACGGPTVVGDDTDLPIDPATPCAAADAPEGAFLEQGMPLAGTLAACENNTHAFAGAGGSTIDLLWTGSDATLEVVDFNGTVLTSEALRDGGRLTYTLQWSGEHLVRILPDDPTVASDYTVTARCETGCDLKYTRYPLFFMHGMAGTDSFLDTLDYWYGVRGRLEPLGYAMYDGAVDPFNASEVRAAQWMEQIDAIVATGQARRFNLIGHSQGGIDARYLTTILDTESRVVSVTTISTPHLGSGVTDIVGGLTDNPGITGLLIDQMFDAFTAIYDTDNDQDILAQLDNLSAATMTEFNATVVDRPDVYYASWAGVSCGALDVICQFDNGGEIVTPLFAATHLGLELIEGENDGLVTLESARWGDFLGTLPADHLDEIGLMPGTTAPGFDHLQFFEDDAQRLADQGF